MAGRHLGPTRQKTQNKAASTPRSRPVGGSADSPTNGDHIDADIIEQVRRRAHSNRPERLSGPRDIAAQYRQLGVDKVEAIVKRTLGASRSRSTLNRWRRDNRIPDPALAERLRREAVVSQFGATRAAAAQRLGVSPSTIGRYVRGETKTLKSPTVRRQVRDAQRQVDAAARDIAADEANVDNHSQPTIRLRADLSIITPSNPGGYTIGFRDITMHPGNLTMSEDLIAAMFDAYLTGDDAALTAALEAALTVDYFGANYDEFSRYDEDSRVRIDRIESLSIDWETL